ADHVAGRDRVEVERIERFIDDIRIAPAGAGRGGEYIEPPWGDDGDAERLLAGVDEVDSRHGGCRHSMGSKLASVALDERTTLPSAISCWAVTASFGDTTTRGVQPRLNWPARRPDSTENSNAFIPSGRLTMRPFVVQRTRKPWEHRCEALMRLRPRCPSGSEKQAQYRPIRVNSAPTAGSHANSVRR